MPVKLTGKTDKQMRPTMNSEQKTRECIICHQQTTGSIGAAGIRWVMICQPCKNREDAAIDARMQGQIRMAEMVDRAILGGKPR